MIVSPTKKILFNINSCINKNIPVKIISTTLLHGDDTIGMIKKKIVHALELEISTKEMYLFGITKPKLNSSTLYKQLTQQETIPLTQEILCTLLLNIVENGCDDSEAINTNIDCNGGFCINNCEYYNCDNSIGESPTYIDQCGICNDDLFDDCVQDCAGEWGG